MAAQRGHSLRLYFNQAPPPHLFPSAPHVAAVHIPFARLWSHSRLAWELRRRPPDLFFTPAHVIPFSYRGAAVATVHDLGFHYFPEAHTQFQRRYLHWSTAHNARRSNKVIADSEATKRDLVAFYGVAPQKVTVVYPGIDPQLAPVDDEQRLKQVQERYGLTSPYLLYLGTLQPRKNIERLVEAYARSGVAAQLALAGKAGWLSEAIVASVARTNRELEGARHIQMTGYVAEEDKAALLSGATALLFPSLYEGFGFPILEAQRCLTPVLCAGNSSQPEVAGDAALFVEATDTQAIAGGIRRLVQDGDLRRRLVAAGQENVQRFSWKQAAAQVMVVLEQAGSGKD